MIQSDCAQHGATINALAKAGVLPRQEFILDGTRYEANCLLSAMDYLIKIKAYDKGRKIEWV